MARPTAARTWTGVAIVAALAAVVGVLAVLAMQRVSSGASPTVSPGGASPTAPAGTTPPASPSETPTPTPTAPAPVAAEAERLLAAGTDGILWRGTAGSCTLGVAPVLERSADDGLTWTDVTPAYRGITQIVGLDDFAGVQAQMIATVLDDESADDPCDVRAMRTFSDGAFWSDYEDVLAGATYLAPGGAIVTPEGEIEAPCAEPRSVRGAAAEVALVCDGSAMRWDGAAWIDAGVPGAVAVAPGEGGLYVGHVAPECAGLQISAVAAGGAPEPVECIPGVDAGSPLALDATASDVWLWTGDEVLSAALAPEPARVG
ncbi:hypothetical protein [Microbacterium sp. NPDC096154]|uniref:hypothetical protein n=1 Tax=Microbacterium sp. NPDC096154 TaxID=3155549 RepID=UPI00332FA447